MGERDRKRTAADREAGWGQLKPEKASDGPIDYFNPCWDLLCKSRSPLVGRRPSPVHLLGKRHDTPLIHHAIEDVPSPARSFPEDNPTGTRSQGRERMLDVALSGKAANKLAAGSLLNYRYRTRPSRRQRRCWVSAKRGVRRKGTIHAVLRSASSRIARIDSRCRTSDGVRGTDTPVLACKVFASSTGASLR
jgi:hypothetical protein